LRVNECAAPEDRERWHGWTPVTDHFYFEHLVTAPHIAHLFDLERARHAQEEHAKKEATLEMLISILRSCSPERWTDELFSAAVSCIEDPGEQRSILALINFKKILELENDENKGAVECDVRFTVSPRFLGDAESLDWLLKIPSYESLLGSLKYPAMYELIKSVQQFLITGARILCERYEQPVIGEALILDGDRIRSTLVFDTDSQAETAENAALFDEQSRSPHILSLAGAILKSDDCRALKDMLAFTAHADAMIEDAQERLGTASSGIAAALQKSTAHDRFLIFRHMEQRAEMQRRRRREEQDIQSAWEGWRDEDIYTVDGMTYAEYRMETGDDPWEA
jgi:hypothetical protein